MKLTIFLFAAFSVTTCTHAQDAYWVIETSGKSPDKTLVRVYDLANTLIAEREFEKRLTLASRRHKRMLNRIADHAVRERQNALARKWRRSRGSSRALKV